MAREEYETAIGDDSHYRMLNLWLKIPLTAALALWAAALLVRVAVAGGRSCSPAKTLCGRPAVCHLPFLDLPLPFP